MKNFKRWIRNNKKTFYVILALVIGSMFYLYRTGKLNGVILWVKNLFKKKNDEVIKGTGLFPPSTLPGSVNKELDKEDDAVINIKPQGHNGINSTNSRNVPIPVRPPVIVNTNTRTRTYNQSTIKPLYSPRPGNPALHGPISPPVNVSTGSPARRITAPANVLTRALNKPNVTTD